MAPNDARRASRWGKHSTTAQASRPATSGCSMPPIAHTANALDSARNRIATPATGIEDSDAGG
jgi:hypothetical protein